MTNENDVMKFNEAIQYSGKVKISIQDEHQILYKKEIHNAGTNTLLKFLVNCVAGQNQLLNNRLRPAKIALFTSAENGSDTSDPNSWSEQYVCSIPTLYDTTPTIDMSTSGDYFTNFHFRIPYSFIKKPGVTVNRIALYPKLISNYFSDMIAWISLEGPTPETDKQIKLPASAPLGYTIIIDWELHFKN